ncbi:hypothetical protein EOS_25890 [Caballeronia mineralivorans PML1(12)]|uniref:Uncharacterized protein n=1 Tax=Caballeronia mineralivorans PML1(12) TaxID=908627 RepID=A0A0J1CRX9_9BURK|nr:hypothetical protein EOS_25890 [Caballeronia mineralivorans PML1(12)]
MDMDIPTPMQRVTRHRTTTDIRLSTVAGSTLVEAGAAITTMITAVTGMVGTTGTAAAITVVAGTAAVAVAAGSGRVAADTLAVAGTAVATAKKNAPSSFAARLLISVRSTCRIVC